LLARQAQTLGDFMAGISKLGTGALLPLVLVAACDSTSPASDRLLHVSGEVIEEGQAPAPPLDVDIQAWPALGSDGIHVATLRTDAAGRFTAELGPFPDPLVDSLLVRVTQNDCDFGLTTELRHRDLALGDGEVLVLPSIALSYRLPSAEFGSGQEMCGAIVTPFLPEAAGDYARLALWIDEVSDSVRGRLRVVQRRLGTRRRHSAVATHPADAMYRSATRHTGRRQRFDHGSRGRLG
jgi:hypothetical protein